ncbi:MAG TPA: protein-L-isoaspartate(D-aspartate) O-methyltransferase [Solirubrobacteraceae bacterium]|nr:protein-L-isoaspartate(D-aspartate) O-methyltransferase [Solirubrobacteraceae bacterium]
MGPAELDRSLRAAGIVDERVLAAIASVPRDRFTGAARAHEAWADRALPISCGQTISQPTVVARMCELLDVRPGDRVLDVGTGSGYHAAVLAALGGRVWGVERHPELARRAAQTLAELGIEDVEVVAGDGMLGHPPAAPYDAINVAATATGDVPPALLDQLAPGGRLVAPVRDGGDERLVLVVREADGSLRRTLADHVRFVPLVPGEPG